MSGGDVVGVVTVVPGRSVVVVLVGRRVVLVDDVLGAPLVVVKSNVASLDPVLHATRKSRPPAPAPMRSMNCRLFSSCPPSRSREPTGTRRSLLRRQRSQESSDKGALNGFTEHDPCDTFAPVGEEP